MFHRVPAGRSAKGWVNTLASKFWSPQFGSMLLYSIGEDVVTENTGVFLRRSAASMSTLEYPNFFEEWPSEPDDD